MGLTAPAAQGTVSADKGIAAMNKKAGWVWIMLGALSAGIAVFCGALGAHLPLDGDPLQAQRARWIDTAQYYQMVHALGLALAGSLVLYLPGRLASLAAWSFCIATLCFSGGLYLQAFADVSVGPVVPLGGGLFIFGWLMLALYAGKAVSSASSQS